MRGMKKICVGLAAVGISAIGIQALAQTRTIPPQERVFPYTLPTNPQPGDRANICTGNPVPAGWIWVDQLYSPSWAPPNCYDPGYPVNNVSVLEYYVGFAPGKILSACNGAGTPSGWIVHDSYHDAGSCKFTPANNVIILEKYDGLPIGSEISYCTLYSAVPSGWSVVGQSYSPNNCGEPTYVINNTTVIKRVQ